MRIALSAIAVFILGPAKVAPSYGAAAATQTQSQDENRSMALSVLNRLDAAWNAASGKAFAQEFSDDATVINIFGGTFNGRPAVEQRMQTIFDTIFKGSVHKSRELEAVRVLAPGVVIAVSSAIVSVPSGPLAPEAKNRQTFVLVNGQGTWKIQHWHNTPIRESP